MKTNTNFLKFSQTCAAIATPSIIIPELMEQEGGTLKLTGSAYIDGTFEKTTFRAVKGEAILLSALSMLNNCVIHCKDIMIEGDFTGDIYVKDGGTVEIGCSAVIRGTIYTDGMVIRHPLSDTGATHDLRILKFTIQKQELTMLPVGNGVGSNEHDSNP